MSETPRLPLPAAPARRLAIVTCMDARVDPLAAFGLALGDAHVIRNAGGIVTDDVLRSLAISQTALDTREIVVMMHTDCGLLGSDERELTAKIEAATGAAPAFELGAFTDLEARLKRSIRRIEACPFLPSRGAVRGVICEVETGRIRAIDT